MSDEADLGGAVTAAGAPGERRGAGALAVEDAGEGVTIVALRGEHDLYTAQHVRESLTEPAETGIGVVVDVSETTFMDSTVLRVLFDALRLAREQGKGFAVVTGSPPPPEVARVFEISGVTRLLPVYHDRARAVQAARLAPGASG
jgi:anti-sigma B factor antagonist